MLDGLKLVVLQFESFSGPLFVPAHVRVVRETKYVAFTQCPAAPVLLLFLIKADSVVLNIDVQPQPEEQIVKNRRNRV